MAREIPNRDISAILTAARSWIDSCLIKDGSILSSTPLWTPDNVQQVRTAYVDHPDLGDRDFITKLTGQMADGTPEAKRLMAEMLWALLLFPSNLKPETKRRQIRSIWTMSGKELPVSDALIGDGALIGIGSGGSGFNNHRWRELAFLVRLTDSLKQMVPDERRRIFSDYDRFMDWIDTIPQEGHRQFRHMLRYFAFPDQVERMTSNRERRAVLEGFKIAPKKDLKKWDDRRLDAALLTLRDQQQTKYPDQVLDFYNQPLRELWIVEGTEDGDEEGDDTASTFSEQTKGVNATHVLKALKQIDTDGFPHEARSAVYDLIYQAHRYPPKYVLSLATKFATGEALPRAFFSGGEKSQSFRLLRRLGFDIERKDFISELLARFIKQADEASDRTVSEYPKKYRGLSVKVSFGMGLAAKVPWISFTGYDQTTSDGIYPVLLYYRAQHVLVVAYGISETNDPKVSWNRPQSIPTIKAHLEGQYSFTPERYGASYVHTAFDVTEGLDSAGIQVALDDLIGQYHSQFSSTVIEGTEPPSGGSETLPIYSLAEALKGLFIAEEQFAEILGLLKQKKNMILQGPPGVGKTFVCKRLAYALMGEKATDRLQMVQFHQSYAYEDFMQGFRPSGQGFRLKNGVFYEFCEAAKDDPGCSYVFVIDEINRGNLSKVLGEAMMLIEADKRGPEWAIPLTYSEATDHAFYVPENVYLIGLMNTADRSLAMVDYALRRRFAFVDLVPGFETDEFWDFLESRGAEAEFIDDLISRLGRLNRAIAEDTANLGAGYCIGHSFFCVVSEGDQPDWEWYTRIVKSEVAPLLREYYFDNVKRAAALVEDLLRQQ